MKISRVEEMDCGTRINFGVTVGMNHYYGDIRGRVSKMLRALADKVDGRFSLAYNIATDPVLSDDDRIECLVRGAKVTQQSIFDLTREKALDEAATIAAEKAIQKVST